MLGNASSVPQKPYLWFRTNIAGAKIQIYLVELAQFALHHPNLHKLRAASLLEARQ